MNLFRRLSFDFSYLSKPPWDSGISPPELMEFIRNHAPGRALDLGCGTATNVITLAQAGWQVTGVDFSWRAVRKGYQKLRKTRIEAQLLVDDVTKLREIHGSYELILDIGCYHSLPVDIRPAYRTNIDRLLAPQGFHLLYAFLPSSPGSLPGITQDDLEALNQSRQMVNRRDSPDRQGRASTWLCYQKDTPGG